MENKLHILEPLYVVVTCSDGTTMRYDDYMYCGNGMLCYYNSDYARYPSDNNFIEVFGKFSNKYGPVYYIPRNFVDRELTAKFKRIHLKDGYSLADFEISKIVDADTIDNCRFDNSYFWFERFKKHLKNSVG